MASNFKVLGQSAPLAATLTAIYTVPALSSAIVSTVMVCNRSAIATNFRIAVAPSGAADSIEQYQYYDLAIKGNDTFAATLGWTLATTDVIRVYATLATLSFSVFGDEVT